MRILLIATVVALGSPGCFVELEPEPVCFGNPAVTVDGDGNSSEKCCDPAQADADNECEMFYDSTELLNSRGERADFRKIAELGYCDERGFCRLACDDGRCECRLDRDCTDGQECTLCTGSAGTEAKCIAPDTMLVDGLCP